MPVLFLQHSWWVTFPEDPSSLSVHGLWMQQGQPGAGMVCIQHQPMERKSKVKPKEETAVALLGQIEDPMVAHERPEPTPLGVFFLM